MYKLFKTSDVTNIANAIREKTGKTDTMKIAEMPSEIESISSGGSGKNINIYATFIQDETATSTTLTYAYPIETSGYLIYRKNSIPGFVFMLVRSEYTVSDNVSVIAETDWFSYDYTQKLVVGWCDNVKENITLNQASSGRLAIGLLPVENVKKPTSENVVLNKTYGPNGGIEIVTPSIKPTIYFDSGLWGSTNKFDNKFSYSTATGSRLGYGISYDDLEKTIELTGISSCGLIGIELEVDE